MHIPSPPQRFRSKSARERWHRLCEDLVRAGLDPSSRIELLTDYVDAERHIASLRPKSRGSADVRLAQARALNVATAERRRLHQRLFAGARRVEEVPVSVQERTAAITAAPTIDADEAWRRHLHRQPDELPLRANTGNPAMDKRIAEWEAERRRIEATFGPPSWNALLYRDAAEQAEADRRLEDYWNARPAKKARMDRDGGAPG